MKEYPFLIAGNSITSQKKVEIINPFNRQPVGSVCLAGPSDVENAIRIASETFQKSRKLPSHERARMLMEISKGLASRKEETAKMIVQENGKPIRDARMEVDRASMTFEIASEEAKRISGELIPMDL